MSIESELIMFTTRMGLFLFVLAATALATSGQEIKIVVPNRLENVEGPLDLTTGPTPYRWQQLSMASEFASLPQTHHAIIGAFERPDRTITSPRTIVYNDLQIRLSTTPNSVLNTAFDENVGEDVTTVIDGRLVLSTQAVGPPEGPREFDYYYEFETPFVYDPSHGNLLMDTISFSGQSPPTTNPDFDNSTEAIWSSDPNARTGTRVAQVSIIQLIFVPGPQGGDFDCDGWLTATDIDMLTAAAAAGDDPAFDLTGDSLVDEDDVDLWVKDLRKTWYGDGDLNGEFNTGDLVQVLTAGKYETQQSAGWAEGDWNGDGRFGTGDLVKALEDGGYELGPKENVAVVPEPATVLLLMTGLIGLAARRRPQC